MKVWFNKINESRRNVVEVSGSQITIGRDAVQHGLPAKPAGLAAACRGAAEQRQAGAGERRAEQLRRGRRGGAGRADRRVRAGHQGPHLALHAHLRGREGRHHQPRRAGSPPALDHGRPGAEDPPEAAGTARPLPVRDQPRQRPAEHPAAGKQHRGRLPRAERLRSRERAAAGGDHRPDAPRPPGQPDHHGDGRRRRLRPGRADLQRVRPAGHARAGARGRAARPVEVPPRAAEPGRSAAT